MLGAGLYLRSRADVDPARVGLWGGSYGGYLTALGLARASHLFAAGVDLHGVHDWNVPFSETVDLVAALRKQGVEIEELVYPDEVHDFLVQSRWVEAFQVAAGFFDRGMPRARP